MKYIQGQNRSQTYLFLVTLDDAIGANNEVRLIDIFVHSLALESYGFQIDQESLYGDGENSQLLQSHWRSIDSW
ncbi:MAG: hypothetical protein DRR42_14250 [Gammaproteobacteria bacterium]|nr:MAG: hypothetical protein DRR42_14250 [Gammaproteobacteria bacterium]